MIDIGACTDGYNEDWKVRLRDKLSEIVASRQCSDEVYTDIGYCYQCYAPAFLYKYYRDDNPLNFEAVKNNEMWYSSAINFNDVLDCDIFVDEASIFQSIVDASASIKGLKKGSPMWREFKSQSTRSTQGLRKIFEELKAKTGIACLSELDDSLLMWSHYANNHKGFCVEYELLEINKQLQFTPIPIIYSNEKVVAGSLFPHSLDKSVTKMIVDGLSTKSTEWSYEKEWRIIRDDKACGDRWNCEKFGALLPMIRPTSIILGCESTSSFQAIVEPYCRENRINLFRMEKDNHLYKLNKNVILSFDT